MPRLALGLWASGLLAGVAFAQQSPPDPAAVLPGLERQIAPLATSWLHNADPRLEAWGAYLALRDLRTEANPDLLALLAGFPVVEHPASQLDVDEHDAMMEVLDALIQFGAPVPMAQAQRIYPEFPVQSLILLARSQEDTAAALLAIFRSEPSWPAAWLAAGALLVNRRAEGFAAAVLESMAVHAVVTVTEPGSGGGMGGSAFCCGGSFAPRPKTGWPPVGVYFFAGCSDRLQPGATVLAGGTDPSYYVRQVNATYQPEGASPCACNPDRDLVRQHYLTTLLHAGPEHPPMRAHVSRTITSQGPEAYRNNLAAFIADQQDVFAELAQRMGGQNLLSSSEANSLRPKLQIRVWDQRTSSETALPAIAMLPENITVEPF